MIRHGEINIEEWEAAVCRHEQDQKNLRKDVREKYDQTRMQRCNCGKRHPTRMKGRDMTSSEGVAQAHRRRQLSALYTLRAAFRGKMHSKEFWQDEENARAFLHVYSLYVRERVEKDIGGIEIEMDKSMLEVPSFSSEAAKGD